MQTVEGLTCITIFGIDEDIMDKERKFRGGTKTMFGKSLLRKLGAGSIEHTNETETLGKLCIPISKKRAGATRE